MREEFLKRMEEAREAILAADKEEFADFQNTPKDEVWNHGFEMGYNAAFRAMSELMKKEAKNDP